MAERPDLDGYRAAVARCCGSKAGEQFCESFGCWNVVDLLTYAADLERALAALRDGLQTLEWDEETDNEQCAWCLGARADGHLEGCKFAALAALSRGGGGA